MLKALPPCATFWSRGVIEMKEALPVKAHTTERMAPNWIIKVRACTKASPWGTPNRFWVIIM
jgi:hypothetical protein